MGNMIKKVFMPISYQEIVGHYYCHYLLIINSIFLASGNVLNITDLFSSFLFY